MNPRLRERLDKSAVRLAEISRALARPAADGASANQLRREYGELAASVEKYREWRAVDSRLADAELMRGDADSELAALADEEAENLRAQAKLLADALEEMILGSDEDDHRGAFLEIRAAVGGNESCLFAADLFRMYSRYAESQGWKTEAVSQSAGEVGGYREIIVRIAGKNIYGKMKFESGAHRVQRVPATESQGRIHTSVCTVAVLPEADDKGDIAIRPQDIRVDTFRSSGAGGQHVNTTDSAVRITHLPSGLAVECQDDRSQHKNRERAMAILRARLRAKAIAERREKESQERKRLVGSGDRSDRIRTYNFPQGRISDHRINLTLYKINEIMEGNLNELLDALARAKRMEDIKDLCRADA